LSHIVLIWLQDMELHMHPILGAILASIPALVYEPSMRPDGSGAGSGAAPAVRP